MYFHEKLSVLMQTFTVSNSRLALALSVDTSLISRWRNGSRAPGKKNHFITSISRYFADVAKLDYQRIALCELIGMRYEKQPSDFLALALEIWLSDHEQGSAVENFLSEISVFTNSRKGASPPDTLAPKGQDTTCEVYYDMSGKREAILCFLMRVLDYGKPCKLFFYSDEGMEWLFEDNSFLNRWELMTGKIIELGCEIKIIHTISRDSSQMLLAVEAWLPLYMTGAVESYYYPKYTQGTFCRTRLIAQGLFAINSECLHLKQEHMVTYFHSDRQLVHALEKDFEDFQFVCRPLMRIVTLRNNTKSVDLVNEFLSQPGDVIFRSDCLSISTMPPELFSAIAGRAIADPAIRRRLINAQNELAAQFDKNLSHHLHTEYVSLPNSQALGAGQVTVPYTSLFGISPIPYTPQEYALHLRAIVRLLEEQAGYNFYITGEGLTNVSIVAKDDIGALIVRKTEPPAIFALNQPSLTTAIYSHLDRTLDKVSPTQRARKITLERIRKLITQLESLT